MRHSPFTAVYDANVLYPAPLRDLLMHLALTGIYRARWTVQIHDEWKRNLLINRPDLTQTQLDRTSMAMDRAIPDALVTGYASLYTGLTLPDPDDRHILAAAIKCSASVIVTFNLKDFPPDTLQPFDIEAVHPDDFIADLFDLDRAAVLEAVQAQRASLKNPPYSARELLEQLLAQGLAQSVELLSEYEQLI
ncbi:PIN domain-containing protein [Pseudomonas asplenii]|uniref:PIN domain-containing protein n=1 Tax=Pseudomonas asplenii TaxID=53407 RepID=A0A1H1XH32_9PSED|nr:PIN domain-containing protein [Pseudomonas asplenii]SDT08563.1 PIN domain-containing protein [Pseudomonas asplenii]